MSITLRELVGWSGVVAARDPGLPGLVIDEGVRPDDGDALPVYHVLADLLGPTTAPRRIRSTAPSGIGCIALGVGRGVRVILANLAPSQRTIRVRVPATGPSRVRTLDHSTLETAVRDPGRFRAARTSLRTDDGIVTLRLDAYGIACIDIAGDPVSAGASVPPPAGRNE